MYDTCFVSNAPITPGDHVKLFYIAEKRDIYDTNPPMKNKGAGQTSCTEDYLIIGFPVEAVYDEDGDYQHIDYPGFEAEYVRDVITSHLAYGFSAVIDFSEATLYTLDKIIQDEQLVVSRNGIRSRVHRVAVLDYIYETVQDTIDPFILSSNSFKHLAKASVKHSYAMSSKTESVQQWATENDKYVKLEKIQDAQADQFKFIHALDVVNTKIRPSSQVSSTYHLDKIASYHLRLAQIMLQKESRFYANTKFNLQVCKCITLKDLEEFFTNHYDSEVYENGLYAIERYKELFQYESLYLDYESSKALRFEVFFEAVDDPTVPIKVIVT